MRVAFRLQVRPELLDEYRDVHSPVRRDMLEVITASGRRNYSLFLDETDGSLFGYYEVDDDEAAQASLAASVVATAWEATMSRYFVTVGGSDRADHSARRLPEVFNLEDQLRNTADQAAAAL